ncbi:MAG: L-serine ammonia-lyase, iron-sulfur-dependent, subunit alpha [Firmicutes bacterium]|nr:L-serine ammonia-lyase, iron-sulfur-dependent, subunit alpha [Bacillota bacterium]MDD4694248.1 L-serine ammonia-lyase, iron-sulfur-dependent, subunit alpha [Bacillota bacterium]
MSFTSVKELIDQAIENKMSVAEVVLKNESEDLGVDVDSLRQNMQERISIMRDSMEKGLKEEQISPSGLTDGKAFAYEKWRVKNDESLYGKVIARALAVAEVNACMGLIVAAPTAGSCGVLPAVLLTYAEEYHLENRLVDAFFTAGAVGVIIAKNASISGAEGGCQAECGSASAMAAAGLVELEKDRLSPLLLDPVIAMSLQNVLGLVCDPVAGLVEVPCVTRNVMAAVNALSCFTMVKAGLSTPILADETIRAMKEVGDALPDSLKETAKGGIANTPTAKKIASTFLK